VRPIDGLLKIMVQQAATELRLASDRLPALLRGDVELPLTMPATPTETLRSLLGDLWSAHEAELDGCGVVSFSYVGPDLGAFDVTLRQYDATQGSEIDARFVRQRGTSRHVEKEPLVASPAPAPHLGFEVTALVERALALGASDIHLTQGKPAIIRIDGALRVLDGWPPVDIVGTLITEEQRGRVESGSSVDFSLGLTALGRLRVNVYASSNGLAAALRILPRTALRLSDLRLPSEIEALVELPHGLVIVCGPTGCGKSSTLAALAQAAMNKGDRVLITLEDPIEYIIEPGRAAGLVRQREIGTHVRDFATGLRDALREDPDMLLIGEMRDTETISLALTAAETGHLVLASLHSRTTPSSVERIVDTYAPERQRQIRVQLADALRAVVAQRLLPRLDGRGRVPAVELLRVTHAVANLIREGKTAQIVSAVQSGREAGMLALERHLADLVRDKLVDLEAARGVANDLGMLSECLDSAQAPAGRRAGPARL
jgi:twitching motility protein PilT